MHQETVKGLDDSVGEGEARQARRRGDDHDAGRISTRASRSEARIAVALAKAAGISPK